MYQLRKGSHKERCPQCGKKTFTPYVDEFNHVLAPEVGRCNREVKCKYHLPPHEYRRLNPHLFPSRKSDYRRDDCQPRPFAVFQKRNSQPPTRIPGRMMINSLKNYRDNPLAQYLTRAFSGCLSEDFIYYFLREHNVGTSKKYGGSTIFWLVDEKGCVRDGKIMGYDATTGKRVKRPRAQIGVAHTALENHKDGNWRPCMFWSNLAKTFSKLPIWLFESEKAALICALAFEAGGMWLGVPMAVGGCSALNPTKENMNDKYGRLSILKGREVVLFPDEGCYEEWKEKGERLAHYCEKVYVSTVMERSRHDNKVKCDIKPGDGFDDLILRYLANGESYADLLLFSYSYGNEVNPSLENPIPVRHIVAQINAERRKQGLDDLIPLSA